MSRKIPYLQRRGNELYFRIAVPSELRSIIGLCEITRSLHTSDRRIAAPIALNIAAQTKRLFYKLRKNMANESEEGGFQTNYILEIDFGELNGKSNKIKVLY